MIDVEDLRNIVVETVNARDPELLDEAGLADSEALTETVQIMDERWPRMMMTRGDLDGTPVGVVWMPDQNERYRRVAHIDITIDEGVPDASLVEGVDPDLVAESPPGRSVAEWESEIEVDQGEGRWI